MISIRRSPQKRRSNPWNVPDWRNPKEYPKPEELSYTLWRWEFLRRREDYRQDWESFANPSYQWDLSKASDPSHETYQKLIPRLDDRAFRARIDYLAYGSLKQPQLLPLFEEALSRFKKYELGGGLPNPRVRVPENLTFDLKYGSFISGPTDNLFHGSGSRVHVAENDVYIKFDLSEPLQGQVKLATNLLKETQIARFGTKVERRAHHNKWPLYLRVLDARTQGASYGEIGKLLLSNSQREAAGYDYSPRTKVIHDAAMFLSFNFPPLEAGIFPGMHI